MPCAPKQPPEAPKAAYPRGSACTTRANPSAPPAPAMVTMKLAFQDWCVGRGFGAHRPEHCVPPLVSTAEEGEVRMGTTAASDIIAVAHMERSLVDGVQPQLADCCCGLQACPTNALACVIVCVKNWPPVAPVTPQIAVGEARASARLRLADREKERPAPESEDTVTAQVQGLYVRLKVSPSLYAAAQDAL